MSILQNPRQRLEAQGVELLERLRAADATVPELTELWSRANLCHELGTVAGTGEALTEARKALTQAKDRAANLRAAVEAHNAAFETFVAEANSELRKSQNRAAERDIKAAVKAGKEFVEAQTRAIVAYKLMSEKWDAASRMPTFPSWARPHPARLVAGELYRLSSGLMDSGAKPFVGAHAPDLSFKNQPKAITPLIAQLEQIETAVLKTLRS